MFQGGPASDIGDFVAYTASLGAAGAVSFRAVADWMSREARRPAGLRAMSPEERAMSGDKHAWVLWIATYLGGLLGVFTALVVLAFEEISR